MIFKRLGGISFALAFLMGIVLFVGIGRNIVSLPTARILFIVFGAFGLFFNLLGFQTGKHAPLYSLIYWTSTIIIFTGLIFRIMHWPFGTAILIFGALLMGASFFIPSKRNDLHESSNELLDQ